jgi:hypothetical protein
MKENRNRNTKLKASRRTALRKMSIFLFILLSGVVCKAQKIDVKPYIQYHQSITSQNEPVFYDLEWRYSRFTHSLVNENFTIANGLKYGIAINCTFENNLGFEISADYFNTNKTFNDEVIGWTEFPLSLVPGFLPRLKTSWDYRTIAIRPRFTFALDNKKSTFIGKFGPSIGLSMLTLTDSDDDKIKFTTCTFNRKSNWGYSAGFEYNYSLSKRLSLAVELGIEHYRYTPEHSTLKYERTESIVRTVEIDYVDQSNGKNDYSANRHIKGLKQSILFNSIYLGIGIKYNIVQK